MTIARSLAALCVWVAACKSPVQSASVPTATAAASSATSTTTVEPPLPVAVTFTSVLVADEAEPIGLFPAGSRALIARGAAFWGYASAGHRPVQDAHVSDGLPASGAHVQVVGGLWPDVVAVVGKKELTEYAGPDPVLYVRGQGGFVASKAAFAEVARDGATSKGVTYLFIPDSSYFIAGLDTSRCAKSTPEDLAVLTIRGNQKLASPRAAPSFFPQSLANDASGTAFLVGGDMCRPGAFVAVLDGSPVRPELVPSSDACHDRTNAEGMPFTHARLFPRGGGGLSVLLVNQRNTSDPGKGACAGPPRVVERFANGAWSAPRPLAENVSAIDPAGTAWAITDHRTVLRIPTVGARNEITLDPSCAAKSIDALTVPFPDQPWLYVTDASGRAALCVANLDARL